MRRVDLTLYKIQCLDENDSAHQLFRELDDIYFSLA